MAKIAEVQEVAVTELRPYERNAKTHSKEQVAKIAASIEEFGFLSPCLIDRDKNIIAGHGRMLAAIDLGLETVPCVFIFEYTAKSVICFMRLDLAAYPAGLSPIPFYPMARRCALIWRGRYWRKISCVLMNLPA